MGGTPGFAPGAPWGTQMGYGFYQGSQPGYAGYAALPANVNAIQPMAGQQVPTPPAPVPQGGAPQQ